MERLVEKETPNSGGSGIADLVRKINKITIGPVPILIYILICVVVIGAASIRKLPNDIIGGFACILIMGFLFADIGAKVPILRSIGGPAILCLFIPSALVGTEVLLPAMKSSIVSLMSPKHSNYLYLYIACLVAGSLLGMNRRVLIQGFLRMFVPLAVGTVAAVCAGLGAGLLFGYELKHTFFFIIIPIMGGGIGEGVLPTSIAYAEILGRPQGEIIAQLIPAALIGNVVAIICGGLLKRIGEKYPQYNGKGLLVRGGNDAELLKAQEETANKPLSLPLMGAGLLIACSFFIAGGFLAPFTGIPGPILMILIGALFKATNLMPEKMEQGAYQMYRFIATNTTYPLLVGLGVLYVPWNKLIASFTFSYLIICSVTVLAMVASGWIVGSLMKMYQVETALVNACHSGLGGTGDVAILSAAERMEMMPFAQISTRIGGASMIVFAVFLLRYLT
ncbi:MAG: malate permease [Oxalobacter sp.]|nr:MAG: malate permease [Oxalobacter sp.]